MKSVRNILHLGLDVHKETIAVAIGSADGSVRRYGEIPGHLQAVDQLLTKLQKPGQELRFCYEAGPFGFGAVPALASARLALRRDRSFPHPPESGQSD